jgi:hypothetical protein
MSLASQDMAERSVVHVVCSTSKQPVPDLANSLCAETGEVLLVDGRAAVVAATTDTRTVTTATELSTATTATTTTATGSITAAAGSLDEAHVNLEDVLLLALLLTLAPLLLALDVSILLVTTLQLLGLSPLGVGLNTLVGGTGLLNTKLLVLLLSQFGEIGSVGLVLVGRLLFSRCLRLILVGLGNSLTDLLVIPFLVAAGGTPALVNLLVGVAVAVLVTLKDVTRRSGNPYV